MNRAATNRTVMIRTVMIRTGILLTLGVLTLGASVLTGCRGWTSDKPPVHLNPNMDTQDKGRAFKRSDFFADGLTMRAPVEGTVARGFLREDDALSRGLGADGQPAQDFPATFAATAAAAERGKDRWMIYCAPCHGRAADGKGAVMARPAPGNYPIPAPSMLDARPRSMALGQLYAAIKDGVNNDNMPGYAAQLSEAERWDIVAYIVTLQANNPDPQAAKGARGGVDLSKLSPGEKVYNAKGCNACHTVDGTPKLGPTFKGMWGKTEQTDKGRALVDEAYLKESLANPMAKVVTGFPPVMPPVPLSDQELTDLIDYLKTLK